MTKLSEPTWFFFPFYYSKITIKPCNIISLSGIYFFLSFSLTGWTRSSTGSVRMMLHVFATLTAGMRQMSSCPQEQSFHACTAMLTEPRSRVDGWERFYTHVHTPLVDQALFDIQHTLKARQALVLRQKTRHNTCETVSNKPFRQVCHAQELRLLVRADITPFLIYLSLTLNLTTGLHWQQQSLYCKYCILIAGAQKYTKLCMPWWTNERVRLE